MWPTWDRATTMYVYRTQGKITDYFRAGKAARAEAKPSGGKRRGKAPPHEETKEEAKEE